MGSVITLTTDFGYSDPWVGMMKGVMLSINPNLAMVDLTHGVPPQDILGGALALADSFSFFPKGTVHLAVVDPGVGSRRRPVAVKAGGYYFVGPDNGLLWPALEKLGGFEKAWHAKNEDWLLKPVSFTFHGRDVFAPVAARLSLGMEGATPGPELSKLKKLILPKPVRKWDRLIGQVIHVDVFGNLITNIGAEDLDRFGREELQVKLKGIVLSGPVRTYSEVRAGEAAALIGSSGRLEAACFGGSAAALLDARRGAPVEVVWIDHQRGSTRNLIVR